MKRIYTYVAVLAGALYWCVPKIAQASDQPSLRISTKLPVVTTESDVRVQAALTNAADHDVRIGYTGGVEEYDVEVRDGSGNLARESAYARRRKTFVRAGRSVVFDLEPGRALTEEIRLEDFVDLDMPGVYSIQLFWPKVLRTIESNKLAISVTLPPDVSRAPDVTGGGSTRVAHVSEQPTSAGSPFSLLIEAEQAFILAGRAIRIYIRLSCTADRGIPIQTAGADADYVVEARDENGELVGDTEYNRLRKDLIARGEAGGRVILLKQTDQLAGMIDLKPYVDLSRPGTYTIQLWRRLPEGLGEGQLRSNVVTVAIKPRAVQ